MPTKKVKDSHYVSKQEHEIRLICNKFIYGKTEEKIPETLVYTLIHEFSKNYNKVVRAEIYAMIHHLGFRDKSLVKKEASNKSFLKGIKPNKNL